MGAATDGTRRYIVMDPFSDGSFNRWNLEIYSYGTFFQMGAATDGT